MEDEDRHWAAVDSVTRDFAGLARSHAEELAAGLGLHPTALDWDVLGKKPVALAFTTRDDITVLHVRAGAARRAEVR